MIAGGFVNLFQDSSDCVPGCVGSYVEGFVELRHMQRGDFAEGRLQMMEGLLAFVSPLDTHISTCLAGISPYSQIFNEGGGEFGIFRHTCVVKIALTQEFSQFRNSLRALPLLKGNKLPWTGSVCTILEKRTTKFDRF